MKPAVLFYILILLLSTACAVEDRNGTINTASPDSIYLLLFKKERNLEVWSSENLSYHKQKILPLMQLTHFPIGSLELEVVSRQFQCASNNNFYTHIWAPSGQSLKIAESTLLKGLSPSDSIYVGHLLQVCNSATLMVFPNDARIDKSFAPCINCPRWIPELYSNLLLHLQDFRTENKNQQ